MAENVFTSAGPETGVLEYTFDPPATALPTEGLAWSGDSGGPAFVVRNGTRYIAGVNSGGECCSYGDTDAYTRLSPKLAWIDGTIAAEHAAPYDCSSLPRPFPVELVAVATAATLSALVATAVIWWDLRKRRQQGDAGGAAASPKAAAPTGASGEKQSILMADAELRMLGSA